MLGRPVDDPFVRANTREAFRRYARYWFDSFAIEEWDAADVLDAFSWDGDEHLLRFQEEGNGIIAVLPHLGNWDASARAMADRGLRMVAVAEHLRPERLFQLFVRQRERYGIEVVALDGHGGVGKALTSALADGKLIGLLADRDLTGRGIEVEMFGARRRLPAGPALLAMSTGAPVVVVGTYQTPNGWRRGRLAVDDAGAHRRPSRGRHGDHAGDRARVRALDLRVAGRLARVRAGVAGRRRLMRVALACPYAWDDPGGVQVHVRELAERLRQRGHEVVVLAPTREPPLQPGWCPSGRRSTSATTSPTRRSTPDRGRDGWSGASSRRSGPTSSTRTSRWRPRRGCGRRSRRARPWWARSIRAPRARACTTSPRRCSAARQPIWRCGSRCRSARPTSSDARIGGEFRIDPERRRRRAVRRRRAGRPRPGPKLLFVGRLDERKGFPVAVDAFERLAADRPDVRLIVVGDGPQRDAVDRLPTMLRARVTMLGAVPNEELPPIHAACDLYLGPSTGGESFGIVLVEAMAAGLPVVASDTPGYDEVVTDERLGLLVPPRDPAALAAAAARVLDDAELAGRLRAAGPVRARDFDWSVTVGAIEDAYRDALEIGVRLPLR